MSAPSKKVQPKPQETFAEPENPIVLEREPEASPEVQSGVEVTKEHGTVEQIITVNPDSSEAQFRIVTH